MKLITLVFIQLCVVALVSSSGRPPRPRPTTLAPCDDYGDCPAGYVCKFGSCVPVLTTTTKKPTRPPCCYSAKKNKNCYICRRFLTCYKGKYCLRVLPTPRPKTTTTPKPPTPCDEYGNCPGGYKCKGDVCVKDY
ncbi:hypothetical protein ACQ4LE_003447 [Meloidogyne hapla]|uniref:CC domain-containing protein n=1 Tax=Meloidogyne hapla TaxID=6305 RepID=A0A1I8BNA0_MELHA